MAILSEYRVEEASSKWSYPAEYAGPKPIEWQIKVLAESLKLDPVNALGFAKNLPKLPNNAEGWFAIPSIDALVARSKAAISVIDALVARFFPKVTDSAEKYCQAVMLVHEKIGDMTEYKNYYREPFTKKNLQMHEHTAGALDLIQEQQKGDILIIAAQLGMLHRGRSTRRAHEAFGDNEYGLNSLMGCSIALTHPYRFAWFDQLNMGLPGDRLSPGGSGDFDRAPLLYLFRGKVEFGWDGCETYGAYGSASGFLPQ